MTLQSGTIYFRNGNWKKYFYIGIGLQAHLREIEIKENSTIISYHEWRKLVPQEEPSKVKHEDYIPTNIGCGFYKQIFEANNQNAAHEIVNISQNISNATRLPKYSPRPQACQASIDQKISGLSKVD